MADTVTSDTLFSGTKRQIRKFTNHSDGTGESAVTKIDISGLPGGPSAVKIDKVWYDIEGMQVKVLFDHTADDTALILSGSGQDDFNEFGGIKDPASAGGEGDIKFTTIDAGVNSSYSITLQLGLS